MKESSRAKFHNKSRNKDFQNSNNRQNSGKRYEEYKESRHKKHEQEKNANILPGLKSVLELLQTDAGKIDQVYLRNSRSAKESNLILDLCRENHIRFALVNDEALYRLSDGIQHQGVVARLRGMSYVQVEDLYEQAFNAPLPLIIALDQVLDPGNVGTLVRTLYALGAAGLIVPRHNSAFLGAGAQRSAAGTLEKLPIAEVVNLARTVELATKSGFTTYTAELDGINVLTEICQNSVSDKSQKLLQLPALLVLGSEEKGVRQGIQKHCQHRLTIPFLREFDSLNVAQAGAILTSCFLRAHLSKEALINS